MTSFRAFLAVRHDGVVDRGIETLTDADLMDGDVTIEVEWSSVNYKDSLACRADGGVARLDRLVPGIDLAGTVAASTRAELPVGTRVVSHCYGLGVSHHGGFAERARVPGDWVVALPDSLTTRQAMVIGTAGYTSALCIHRLEAFGITPHRGPILVTGATGGVGSVAVAILAKRGYEVVASTGSPEQEAWLRELGASAVLDRAELAGPGKPLDRERWAAAVDAVGGSTLAGVIRSLKYGGAVAAVGNTGGRELVTTVFPFILRGVALLGVDAVQNPIAERTELWHRLAGDLRPPDLDGALVHEVGLSELDATLDAIGAGRTTGRVVVDVRR